MMWQEFEQLLSRHGEVGVQAILEKWEHFEGIRIENGTPLINRWINFYQSSEPHRTAA